MKELFVLIGLKGSGKTYIGTLAEEELAIPFLRVEPIFLSVKGDRNYFDKDYITEGFLALELQIQNLLGKHDRILIESTGVADEFKNMIARILNKGVAVKYIKIDTSSEMCLHRVKNRDLKGHVNVSDEDVLKINKLALEQVYDYDVIVDNKNSSDKEIIQALSQLL